MNTLETRNLLAEVDAEAVLRAALARGGDFADVFAEEKSTTVIEIEDQRVERLIQGRRAGAGVRALNENRAAYSHDDRVETDALLECARVDASAAPGNAPGRVIPLKGGVKGCIATAQPPENVGAEEKLGLMWRAEKAARGFDRRIVQVKVLFADQVRRIAVAASDGLRASDRVTYTIFYVFAVAADDSGIQIARESAGGTMGMELFAENPPEQIAALAAERAIRNLSARPAPAGPMPVVLAAEAGGTMVHEAIGHGLEADLAEEGLSVYSGRLGETVASPLITVVDDSTVAGRRGSFSIDDEGTPARRTVLVDQGVLKGYLYDRRLAMKYGKQSTGNGRRESYGDLPIVRMTNTMILPGAQDPAAILRSVERGLLVKRMGGGEVNTVNGDFVFEVEDGWLIEKGAPTDPVRGATLIGNGPKVLKLIDMVGSDLGFGLGTCGKDGQGVPVADAQPTLRIPEITVGGRMEE